MILEKHLLELMVENTPTIYGGAVACAGFCDRGGARFSPILTLFIAPQANFFAVFLPYSGRAFTSVRPTDVY